MPRTLEGSPGFFGEDFFAQKCPLCGPETAKKESSPFLSLGFGVLFLLRRVLSEGFVQRTPCFVVDVYSLVLGVRFCMVFFMRIREFFLRRFRASGLLFPGSALLLSSSSFFFPLSPLGVGLGFFSLLLCVCPQDLVVLRRQVRHCTWPACCSPSLSFLSARAGSPLPPSLCSFSLFFFLHAHERLRCSGLHARHIDTDSEPT